MACRWVVFYSSGGTGRHGLESFFYYRYGGCGWKLGGGHRYADDGLEDEILRKSPGHGTPPTTPPAFHSLCSNSDQAHSSFFSPFSVPLVGFFLIRSLIEFTHAA
jgi:hypothetical protein